eukprot:Skav224041  [mRNA]  locus=scaffold2030:47114:48459:+ [translate_table: standard]
MLAVAPDVVCGFPQGRHCRGPGGLRHRIDGFISVAHHRDAVFRLPRVLPQHVVLQPGAPPRRHGLHPCLGLPGLRSRIVVVHQHMVLVFPGIGCLVSGVESWTKVRILLGFAACEELDVLLPADICDQPKTCFIGVVEQHDPLLLGAGR